MPYIWTEPELVLTHQGVSVYYTYRNDYMEEGSYEYHYTTDIGEQSSFDIRDLDSYQPDASLEDILVRAIEAGEITALEE